jgi:hypothetical protein
LFNTSMIHHLRDSVSVHTGWSRPTACRRHLRAPALAHISCGARRSWDASPPQSTHRSTAAGSWLRQCGSCTTAVREGETSLTPLARHEPCHETTRRQRKTPRCRLMWRARPAGRCREAKSSGSITHHSGSTVRLHDRCRSEAAIWAVLWYYWGAQLGRVVLHPVDFVATCDQTPCAPARCVGAMPDTEFPRVSKPRDVEIAARKVLAGHGEEEQCLACR